MSKNYDVIIPVAQKDINFVSRVVDYISRCLYGVNVIYILTSKKNINKISKRLKDFPNCRVVDEDQVISSLCFDKVKKIFDESSIFNRVGWYFQQLLKFAFAQSEYARDFYLSWDADTLPLASIDFFEDNNILYNPKKEYNPNYFKTINKLFGFGKVCNHSFISENMMFSVEIVKKMLEEIDASNNKGSNWVEKILYACDLSNPLPAFSEFETYGSYCFVNYPNLYKIRTLNTFREAGMISGKFISEKRLRYMSFDVDIASFEPMHQPLFPYNLPYIFSKYLTKLKKIFTSRPSQILIMVGKMKNAKNGQKNVVEETLYRLPRSGTKR